MLGSGRAERIVCAITSHTVGLSDLDSNPHATFVMAAQLADLWTRPSSVGSHHDWSCWLEQPGGLQRAYLAAHALRRRQLEHDGTPVSAVTIALLDGHADPTAELDLVRVV